MVGRKEDVTLAKTGKKSRRIGYFIRKKSRDAEKVN